MNEEATLQRIERLLLIGVKNVLNTSEVALLLNLSEDRVRHLANDREIPHYKQNGRLYFSKQEIEQWQMQNRIATSEELKEKANFYNFKHI